MGVGALKNAWCIDATAEAAYLTAAATPDKRHPFRGNLPKIVTESVGDDDALQGTFEHGLIEVPVKQTMAFSPEFDLRLDALATYLKYTFGTLGTTGAGPYVHTCTLNAGDAPSFTGYAQDPKSTTGKLMQYTGCKVQKLTIKSAKGGKMTFSVDIIGSGVHTEQTISLPSLSSPSEQVLAHSMISAFTVNGTSYLAYLADWEITFENEFALDDGLAAGSINLQTCERTGFNVSGRFSLYQEDNWLSGIAALAEARTLAPIVWTATSATHSATINVYKAFLEAPELQGGRSKLVLPVTFKGKYSTSDSKACQAVVTNATTSFT